MQLIVKSEILDKCLTFLDYEGVDLDNKNTMLKPKQMNIGFGARSMLTELGRKESQELRSCRILCKCCALYCKYYQEVS